MYMYICGIQNYTYTHVCISIYICIYVYIYIFIYAYICVYTCTHLYMHIPYIWHILLLRCVQTRLNSDLIRLIHE